MKSNFHKICRGMVPLGLFLLVVSVARGEGNPNDYLHTRTYVGVLGTSVEVNRSGLFNGQNYSRVNNPSYEVDLIPSIDQNFGYGFFIGHREEAYALELSYWQSNHSASFASSGVTSVAVTSPVSVDRAQDLAVYNSVNLDFKRYFLTELQIQPFINLGVSFPWITVSHASAAADPSASQINYGNLTLAGLGLDLGIGVEYYLTPNFSVMGGGYERWVSFDQSRSSASPYAQYNPLSINGNATNDDGSGLIFMVGTTVGFQ